MIPQRRNRKVIIQSDPKDLKMIEELKAKNKALNEEIKLLKSSGKDTIPEATSEELSNVDAAIQREQEPDIELGIAPNLPDQEPQDEMINSDELSDQEPQGETDNSN